MELRDVTIAEPLGVMRIHDRENRRLEMKNRYASALIVPLQGQLRFTQGERTLLADARHPIFVPEGACYLNECLREADSLLFGFHAAAVPADILPLTPIETTLAMGFCERLEGLAARPMPDSRVRMLGETYALLGELLGGGEPDREEALLAPALQLMAEEYGRADLSCADLAQAAHLSEVYLRRLFARRCGLTPFRYLTALRMDRARSLLLEGRTAVEAALSVGYSDVYSFSRAYKRRFGVPPGSTRRPTDAP